MTAPQPAPRPETFRSLAVGALPPDMLAAVLQETELRKSETAATVLVVQAKEWGKNLGEASIRALITWGKAWDVDVATEVDILGGNIYRNANYYLRKLAELVDLEVVDYACADYVHIDDRLEKLGTPAAIAEIGRRLGERIKYGLRDESAAACVFRIKLHNLSEEIIGTAECGWTGKGSKPGKSDPVGNSEPVKTSETRSIRRAMRKVTTHIPAFDAKEKALDEAAKSLGMELGKEIHDTKQERRDAAIKPMLRNAADPYAEDGNAKPEPITNRGAKGEIKAETPAPRTPPPYTGTPTADAMLDPRPPESDDPGIV